MYNEGVMGMKNFLHILVWKKVIKNRIKNTLKVKPILLNI